MENWRQIAHDAKDILTVCLAKAIDGALTAQLGSQWFLEFASADAHEKVSNRITKPSQQSVRDLDLQALLKFLRYRSELTTNVLTHYGFYRGLDNFAADGQRYQLDALLDRLINDFRNRIEAHNRAADIERELSGEGMQRIYGYQEAYQDMVKLSRIFASVQDNSGKSYHQHLLALAGKQKKQKKKLPILLISVIGTILIAAAVALVLLLPGKQNAYYNNAAPVYRQGQVNIQPRQIVYDGNELVAMCYVTNGTEKAVKNIHVHTFRLSVGGQTLALADFGILPELTLAPGESDQLLFRFPSTTVRLLGADLTSLKATVQCSFE